MTNLLVQSMDNSHKLSPGPECPPQTTAEDRALFVSLLLDAKWHNPYARCKMINRAIQLGWVPYKMNQGVQGLPLTVHTKDEELIARMNQGYYVFDKIDMGESTSNGVDFAEFQSNKVDMSSVGVFTLDVENHYLVRATYRSFAEYTQFIAQNNSK